MNTALSISFAKKMNELCDLDHDNLIYSLFPYAYSEDFVKKTHGYSLDKLPLIIDSGQKVLTNIRMTNEHYVGAIIENKKEDMFGILSRLKDSLGLPEISIGQDKISSALAVVSSIYFNTFLAPVQFFLPNSSACCGQWEFWEKTNYFDFLKKINEKEFIFNFKDKLMESKVWNIKFNPEDFSEIVKRRLNKDEAFNKKLDPGAMIKAMIIRIGEMAKPHINYEVVDYSIRSFFTYLGIKNYLRVDREILFLRKFEKEIMGLLGE
tara:strand:- start:495 stop:1289 length:795 start_codon:yes stop_codon:yes gene_type:complete